MSFGLTMNIMNTQVFFLAYCYVVLNVVPLLTHIRT